VDVRRPEASVPPRCLVDTNILYFLHYDRFTNLDALGEGPRPYQTTEYPRYIKRLRYENKELWVHRTGLIELARIVERAELQILYAVKTPDVAGIPPDLNVKAIRRTYRAEYLLCQERVLTYLAAVRKAYRLIAMVGNDAVSYWPAWDVAWPRTVADPEDVGQLVDAVATGLSQVLSDDADWVSLDGITLYTANAVAIRAAQLAGRLTN